MGITGRTTRPGSGPQAGEFQAVSYTHLRAHETVLDLVCRLLLEKKNHHKQHYHTKNYNIDLYAEDYIITTAYNLIMTT